MAERRKRLHAVTASIEAAVDRRIGRRRGEPIILPYRGIGRPGELLLRGRVVVDRKISRATEAEPVWRNLLNAYRRFESDELPGARLIARHRDVVGETVTDEEGYFRLRLDPRELDPRLQWHEVALELEGGTSATAAQVLVPLSNAEFGIISDIDDTIVETNATSLRAMVKSVLLQNAATRPALEGVAELYQALHGDSNPLFYVSSSPWNLYEMLVDYIDIQKIPRGPIFLQDFGIDAETFIHQPHDTHKLREIQLLLDYYPSLPFVLFGDSGQRDPEIYLQAVKAHPERIRAVFMRDVTPASRDQDVHAIVDESAALGVDFIYVSTAVEAMTHARRLGLVV